MTNARMSAKTLSGMVAPFGIRRRGSRRSGAREGGAPELRGKDADEGGVVAKAGKAALRPLGDKTGNHGRIEETSVGENSRRER